MKTRDIHHRRLSAGRCLAAVLLVWATLVILGAVAAQSARPAAPDDLAPTQEQPGPVEQPEASIGTESRPAVVRVLEDPRQVALEQDARDQQTIANTRLVWWTALLAVFTLGLVYIGWKQRQTYEATLTATRVIERASVGLVTLKLDDKSTLHDPWVVTIGLKNFGHTTARIDEAVVILRHGNTLPELPDYDAAPSMTCPPILAAGEQSNWRHEITLDDAKREPAADTLAPIQHRHWVYGRIVFTDVFDGRHEYGFGREWRPQDPALFHKEDRGTRFGYPEWAGYNYAREIKKGKRRSK